MMVRRGHGADGGVGDGHGGLRGTRDEGLGGLDIRIGFLRRSGVGEIGAGGVAEGEVALGERLESRRNLRVTTSTGDIRCCSEIGCQRND